MDTIQVLNPKGIKLEENKFHTSLATIFSTSFLTKGTNLADIDNVRKERILALFFSRVVYEKCWQMWCQRKLLLQSHFEYNEWYGLLCIVYVYLAAIATHDLPLYLADSLPSKQAADQLVGMYKLILITIY